MVVADSWKPLRKMPASVDTKHFDLAGNAGVKLRDVGILTH